MITDEHAPEYIRVRHRLSERFARGRAASAVVLLFAVILPPSARNRNVLRVGVLFGGSTRAAVSLTSLRVPHDDRFHRYFTHKAFEARLPVKSRSILGC